MNNLIRFYNQNRRKIFRIIIIIIFLFLLLQLCNFLAKEKNDVSNDNVNKNSTKTEQKTDNTMLSDQSLTSGKQLSNEKLKKASNIINEFLNYCNDGNFNEAYNLLTDECKEEMYPTIGDFKKIYYDNTFGGEKKSFTIENWIDNTYQVKISENSLATGKISEDNTKQDYITVIEKDKTYKLNINNYIGRKSLNKVTEIKKIKFTIQSVDTYMDYQTYNIQVENNTDNTILLDTGENTKSVYLLDSNKMKYYFYNNELIKEKMKIQGKYKTTIKIKFNNSYSSSKTIKKMIFSNVILNYEDYNKTEDKSQYIDIEKIEINV